MQVKKFEAPTLQEALDNVKRELGPEAIILQTKKNKRGFGLMSKSSVEVTAAVSERSLHKKQFTEDRLPDTSKKAIKKLPAGDQAKLYDKYVDKHLEKVASATQDQVQLSKGKRQAQTQQQRQLDDAKPKVQRPITAVRYADINEDGSVSAPTPKPRIAPPPIVPSGAVSGPIGSGLSVEDEVKYLKRMIHEMKNEKDEGPAAGAQAGHKIGRYGAPDLPRELQDAFEQLVINGVDKRYAWSLIKQVGFELGQDRVGNSEAILDQLAQEIMESTQVQSALSGIQPDNGKGPSVIALVGPTGVGKTTTVAKIASEAIHRRNLKVGLINVDSHKVGAFDQLGTYAKILSVPFRSAASIEDLKSAIGDFQNLDLIIVDTTGRSQRDPNALKEMQEMLQSVPEMRTQLVLSATTRDAELYDMASRFALFRPQGIIMSKLDEATLHGSVYNVSQKVKLPLLYFTTGQRVPEDIEEATRERVVSLVMDL